MSEKKIGLIGAGNMAAGIINGYISGDRTAMVINAGSMDIGKISAIRFFLGSQIKGRTEKP